ncbi:hypothetical protein [Candidatus Poriferisodalis sp.]|uniref:hypothetical protein n=1 Tax=Candidatus Poriferisodalis sp. TaxID=3101277 RepID=UPI003B58C010
MGGYGLGAGRADELAAMVVEVIAGCTRAVVRKIAAGIPAFVQMEREGFLPRSTASTAPPNSSARSSPSQRRSLAR